MAEARHRGVWFRVDGFETHLAHESAHAFGIPVATGRTVQPECHTSDAQKRVFDMFRVHHPHQSQVLRCFDLRQVVEAGSGQPQQLALSRQREPPRWVHE